MCGNSERPVLGGAEEVGKGMEQVVAHGELEGFPENSLLVHLCCLGSMKAPPGDLEGQKQEGAIPTASYCSALLGSSSRAVPQGRLTRGSEGGCGVAAQAPSQLPARFGLLDVWTEGGEQWGLKRSLYSGRKTAFSVHVLLEERPG